MSIITESSLGQHCHESEIGVSGQGSHLSLGWQYKKSNLGLSPKGFQFDEVTE